MNILESYRQKNGLTFEELAERLGMTTVNAWRLCRNGIECPKSIQAISKLTGLKESTVFKLMTEKENDNG